MINSFQKSLKKGKKAEAIIEEFLNQAPLQVTYNVSDEEEYWTKDIDFLLYDFKDILGFEVKSDDTIAKNKNLAFEVVNHRKTGDYIGWFHYCEADYIVFVCPKNNKFYIVDWKQKDKIKQYAKEIKAFNSADGGKSTLLLLNIDLAKKLRLITDIYDYSSGKFVQEYSKFMDIRIKVKLS